MNKFLKDLKEYDSLSENIEEANEILAGKLNGLTKDELINLTMKLDSWSERARKLEGLLTPIEVTEIDEEQRKKDKKSSSEIKMD